MRINIGMSTRGNDLNSDLVKWILYHTHREDIRCRLMISRSNTSAMLAQSHLFKMVQECGYDYDYALFLDTDVCPPDDVIDKLIATGKEVVTAPIWGFDEHHKDIHLNVHYKFDNMMGDRVYNPKVSGVEQIAASSFSCLLVAKRIIDLFKDRGEDPILWSPLIDEKWKGLENDNIFFTKLKVLGIPAYVCWDAGGGIHERRVKLCDEMIGRLLLNLSKTGVPPLPSPRDIKYTT